MALPTKDALLTMDYAWRGAPFVRVPATSFVRTQRLDYAHKGTPFVSVDDNSLPAPGVPRSLGTPFPAVTSYLHTPGTLGSYFRSLSSVMSRLVFPGGGGLATFSWRLWLRRPIDPLVTIGTLAQVTSGASSVTVTVGPHEAIGVTVTDGTTTVSDTSGDPVSPMSGYSWVAVTIAADSGTNEINVSIGTMLSFTIDTSTLTVPAAETELTFTIGSAADGSSPLDVDVSGFAAFVEIIDPDEIIALDALGEGAAIDVGDPLGVWDGTKVPVLYWIEEVIDGVVPNDGSEGAEALFASGEAKSYSGPYEEALTPPSPDPAGVDTTCGIRGFGSPSFLAGWLFPRTAGFGSPSDYAFKGTGFGSPSIGFQRPGTCNPPALAWLPIHGWLWVDSGLSVNDGTFADEGGELVHLMGEDTFPIRGPYTVRLIDANGGYWPKDADGCYSARAGMGAACSTNQSMEFLRFGLPPLPEGVYDIEVSWGNIHKVTLEDSILIVYRNSIREFESLVNGFA